MTAAHSADDVRVPPSVPLAQLVPVAVTMLLLLLVALGAGLSSPWELSAAQAPESVTVPTPTVTIEPPPTPPPGEEPSEMSTMTRITLLGVGLLAAAIAVYLLVLAARRAYQATLDRRARPEVVRSAGDAATPGAVTVVPELRTGVDEAIGRLRGATSSTDAVIAAWLALEESAEASGAPRTAAQTPTELTVAVLDTTPAPAGAVTRLLHLYHLARFTDTPLTLHDVADAHRALEELAGALDHPAGRTASAGAVPAVEPTA